MKLQRTLTVLAIAAASCAAPTATPPPTVPAPSVVIAPAVALTATLAPAPSGLRLPTTARPLSYALALDVDPARTTFSGRVSIEVELTAPAHPLWLNAEHLTIDAARLRLPAGAAPQALRIFLARLATEPDVHARRVLAYAVGDTPAPTLLQRALDLVAAQPSIAPEMLYVFFGDDTPETTAVRLAFLRRHGADVLAKAPADQRARLAPGTCLAEHRAAVIELLDAHFVPLPDYGASSRDRDIAAMDACIARRATQAPRLAAYLASYR